MPFYEREDKIIQILSSYEDTTLKVLSEKLFISLPTLRRDLIKLEKKGIVSRMHGRVSLIKNSADTKIPFDIRVEEHNSAKNIIAKKATEYIKDGNIIMLDGSTSAYCMVPFLAEFKNLIVITSGARTSILLSHYGISNICTGGRMINKSLSYVGNEAISTFSSYNADIAFFSCRGLSDDGNISDNSIEENDVRRAMIKHSKRKYLLCDDSKIGTSHLNNLCNVSELDGVLCNIELSD